MHSGVPLLLTITTFNLGKGYWFCVALLSILLYVLKVEGKSTSASDDGLAVDDLNAIEQNLSQYWSALWYKNLEYS